MKSVKRTVAATKLQEDDLLVGIYDRCVKRSSFSLDGEVKEEEMDEQSACYRADSGRILLRFPLSDVPEKKKGAVGVRGNQTDRKRYGRRCVSAYTGDELD